MIVYTKVRKYKVRNKSKEVYGKLNKRKITGAGNSAGSYRSNWRRAPNFPSLTPGGFTVDGSKRGFISDLNEKMEKKIQ